MLTLYGADLSSPSNKVRFVAHHFNIEYQYHVVKIREGEHRQPEFLAMNPVGKIPVINDDGFYLFESNAICKYLAKKQQSSIYPQELQEQALVDQWMDFISLHISAAVSKVLFNRVFAKFTAIEPDERSVQDGLKFLERFLPIVEARLQKEEFLVLNKITLADFCLIAAIDPAEVAGVDLSQYENLSRYYARMSKEDFYQKCYTKYGDSFKDS